jgi:hypothetical protein
MCILFYIMSVSDDLPSTLYCTVIFFIVAYPSSVKCGTSIRSWPVCISVIPQPSLVWWQQFPHPFILPISVVFATSVMDYSKDPRLEDNVVDNPLPRMWVALVFHPHLPFAMKTFTHYWRGHIVVCPKCPRSSRCLCIDYPLSNAPPPGGGGSLPLVLCDHVRTKSNFMGAIYLLIGL